MHFKSLSFDEIVLRQLETGMTRLLGNFKQNFYGKYYVTDWAVLFCSVIFDIMAILMVLW